MYGVKAIGLLRISEEGELEGIDIHEHGGPNYHFELGSSGYSLPTAAAAVDVDVGRQLGRREGLIPDQVMEPAGARRPRCIRPLDGCGVAPDAGRSRVRGSGQRLGLQRVELGLVDGAGVEQRLRLRDLVGGLVGAAAEPAACLT